MKYIYLLAAAALFLGACSTSNKVAQVSNQKDYNDDVYFADISAREEIIIARTEKKQAEKTYRTDEELYGGSNYGDYNDFGYGYSDRIRRFYYYDSPFFNNNYYSLNPWNDFYGFNNYYGFNNFYGFNNWYNPGVSLYIGVNPWRSRYSAPYWMYGYPYMNRYWGPVSYNNYYPGYGYGVGGGIYNPRPTVIDPNYRARPVRGAENIGGVPVIGTVRRDGQGRIMNTPSRGEANQTPSGNGSSGRISNTPPAQERARPARTETRPSVTERDTPSRQTIQSEPRQPSYPSSGGGGGDSGGGGGSDSRARPSRVGN